MYDFQASSVSGDDLAAALRKMNSMLAEADGCPPLRDPPLQTKVEVLLANLNQLAQQAPSSKLLPVLVTAAAGHCRSIRRKYEDKPSGHMAARLRDVPEGHNGTTRNRQTTASRKNKEVGLTGRCRKR